jgi:hypothetical protein
MLAVLNDLLLMNFNLHNCKNFGAFRYDLETFLGNYQNYNSTSLTALRATIL